MGISFSLIIMSIMLGVGLAMDAFSVSLANGLNEPKMQPSKLLGIAATFAVFQAVMPLIGWVCVHTATQHFKSFEKYIPWIALLLLAYIGGKMLIEGIRCKCEECGCKRLTFSALLIQGVATSIDALSVGFTISEYNLTEAISSVITIAIVTFLICCAGLILGRKFGTKLAGKAGILGGVILIAIGLKIFIEGVFFK